MKTPIANRLAKIPRTNTTPGRGEVSRKLSSNRSGFFMKLSKSGDVWMGESRAL
jgi:hypothetical protein